MPTFIVGESELARRIRAHPWEKTELGAPDTWPESLKTLVSVMLAANQQMYTVWGPSQILLYNDRYIEVLQGHHPNALGRPFLEVWSEIESDLRPLVEKAYAGIPSYTDDIKLILERSGQTVETHFAYSYTPVFNSNGSVDGFFCPCIETTEQVNAEKLRRESDQRKAFLLSLSDALAPLEAPEAIMQTAMDLLRDAIGANRCAYYEIDDDDYVVSSESAAGVPLFAGRYPITNFGSALRDKHFAGQSPMVVDDVASAHGAAECRNFAAIQIGAYVNVTLFKQGRFVAGLSLHSKARRAWTTIEVALAQETAERTWAAVEQARAEAALRESEERQSYLLELSDVLRSLSDPEAIQQEAMRLLGDRLKVSRAQYYIADETGEYLSSTGGYTDGVPAAIGRFRLIEFGKYAYDGFHAGETQVVSDARIDPRISETVLRSYETVGFLAYIGVPFVQRGRFLGTIAVHQTGPRQWTESERIMVEETAERAGIAVEQARAEAALRVSEERFRQFAENSSGALWIRNADTLAMEYVSPSIAKIYGVEIDAFLGDIQRWAAMIVPEDREIALGHIESARKGESVVHEFRIQRPSDLAFRWIRNVDFPLFDAHGRIERIGGIAEDVTEAKLSTEHQAVLLAELQHRVRNIMAIIRSVAARTGERAETVREYAELVAGRLRALARVQALLTRSSNISVGIASIVHDEVSAQAHHEGQYDLDGPDIELSPKAAEVLTLAIHELSTNALKYGALSVPDGKVKVRWSSAERRGAPWLVFDWQEEGAPAQPALPRNAARRRGFGSELIEGRVPYELGGKGKVTIETGGAHCHLEFPLLSGASILETDAPQRATVFGGALDMNGEADLTGRRVLVVEDDYYLAIDAARALQGAGAAVLGPSPSEDSARAELDRTVPDAAVVDINLGPGPSFHLARLLRDKGIPFVFVTGYDRNVIPEEFAEVERIEKPVQLRDIVQAVSKLVDKAAA